MSKITFYTNPMSRGQIARWALHEAGAAYDEVILGYGGDMKSIEYLAVNPMGKVPAILHEGRAVSEAAAICLYLAEAFPEAGLAPRDLAERADYLRWTFFAAGPVEQAVTNRSMGWEVGDNLQVQGRMGYGSYERTVGVLSALFETRDYVCGDRFTAADVYVGSAVDWGLQFKTLPETPALQAYAGRLRQREAYKQAKAIDGAHIAAMQAG
ncbi:MAG: glutathione S-transferase family protein [Notoacmeibacter sp.]|nr:glutathione S-transferase family protein [Notoacmeibacter sp.]MCC0033574.1 glutathione S-transferase family protein [Brucellaceae bacterium]